MAEQTVIGKVGLTPKGEYVPGEVYEILDLVSNDGNSYISRISENDQPLTNADAWMLSAEKGDTFNFEDLTAEDVVFDDTTTQLGETNVQGAIVNIARNGLFVNVKSFGSLGDGINDDWESIQNAINSDNPNILIGKSKEEVFLISRPIKVPSNKNILVNGTIKIKDSHIGFLTEDVDTEDTVIKVEDAEDYFFEGQQIVFVDDNSASIATGYSGIKIGAATEILSVSGDEITIESGLNKSYTVAGNAKIQHEQSVFLIENAENINIFGNGLIDGNKDNQSDVEPIIINNIQEDVRLGCGISVNNSENVNIKGIRIINAPLHGINYKYTTNFFVDKVKVDSSFYKGILTWYCSNYTISNSIFSNAVLEDGISGHNTNTNYFLTNNLVSKNPRYGAYVGSYSKDVYISGLIGEDCTNTLDVQLSERVTAYGVKHNGGLNGHRHGYAVSFRRSYDSEVECTVVGGSNSNTGVGVRGNSRNITIKANVKNLNDNSGVGIIIEGLSGEYPSDIKFVNTEIVDNKVGVSIPSGVKNIQFIDSKISDNITNSLIGNQEDVRFFNVTGRESNNQINGNLQVVGEISGGVSSELSVKAYGGAPQIIMQRAKGTKDSPTAIGNSDNLGRLRIGGYNGTSFSYKDVFHFVSDGEWTNNSQGYQIRVRAGKTGTTDYGVTLFYTYNGISLNRSALASASLFDIHAEAGRNIMNIYNPSFVLKTYIDENGDIYTNGDIYINSIKSPSGQEYNVTVDEYGKLKSVKAKSQTIFNQYTTSTLSGTAATNLIQPDLGLPILEVDDLEEYSSYSGELVLNIENNNVATSKVIELFGAEIYNNTNPSADITAKITFTLNFFNQVGNDIDYKLSWEYLSSGEMLFGEHTETIDNTSNVDFELLVTGHSTDSFNLKKARLCRL